MSSYGIPYMGSKSKIVKELCHIFPPAENFYDLFGGGFAITHYMIKHRSKDYKYFHFNEIRKGVVEIIQDAMAGKYSYEKFLPPFVSREEFFAKKDTCFYTKNIWSFGNNGETYLFGEIEPTKKSLHNAIVFNKFDDLAKKILGIEKFRDEYKIKDRRMFLRNRRDVSARRGLKPEKLEESQGMDQLQQAQQLLGLEWLQGLEELGYLQQLEGLQRLNFYNLDYRKVPLSPNSIVYCDIPYLGAGEYDKNKNFDHGEFYDWAAKLELPVFVSEYTLPDKRFMKVWSRKVKSGMAGGRSTSATENLYCNQLAFKVVAAYHKKK